MNVGLSKSDNELWILNYKSEKGQKSASNQKIDCELRIINKFTCVDDGLRIVDCDSDFEFE